MKWLIGSFIFAASLFFTGSTVYASQSQVLLTEIRLGGSDVVFGGATYKQYARIHNPTSQSVGLQDWKIQYAKASFTGLCQDTTWSSEEVLTGSIEPYTTQVVTLQLTDEAAGSVRIIDAANTVHDMVGWGDARCNETEATGPIPDNSKSLVRYTACDGTYIGADTNNNKADFISNQGAFALIEAPECTPTCLESQQLIDGVCVDDQCTNLDGFQDTVPDGYIQEGFICTLERVPLVINELFPNAKGSDEGEEYIELYNPNDSEVDLSGYSLKIDDAAKEFLFPAGASIPAMGYAAFRDSDMGFSLINTRSKVALVTADGELVDETPYYESAKEGEAWALIDDTWQYTNLPTFKAVNSAFVEPTEEPKEEVKEADLKPCAANQYRSEETNRCRLLASATSELTPCKEGQVRSEETNRCRATVAIAGGLTPCKEGQYRSEETNRCRSIATDANTLAPCKAGQERNPETNRCRNVAQLPVDVAFAPEPVKQDPAAFAGWWAIGGVGALAAGRLGWEWREEIMKGVRAIGSFLTPSK